MSYLIEKSDIKNIFEQIRGNIDAAKRNVVSAINSEMVVLYWNIGKIIKFEILQNMENQLFQI